MNIFRIIAKFKPASRVDNVNTAAGVGSYMLGRRTADYIVIKSGFGEPDRVVQFPVTNLCQDIVDACEAA